MSSYISVGIAASAFVEKSHQHGKRTRGKQLHSVLLSQRVASERTAIIEKTLIIPFKL